MSAVIQRPPKKRGFDPNREAGPDNPLPGQIFDPQTGAFLGYEPTVIDRPQTPPPALLSERFRPQPAESAPQPPLSQRIRQDLSETIMDLRDEPAEVPGRIRERLRDYFIERPKRRP